MIPYISLHIFSRCFSSFCRQAVSGRKWRRVAEKKEKEEENVERSKRRHERHGKSVSHFSFSFELCQRGVLRLKRWYNVKRLWFFECSLRMNVERGASNELRMPVFIQRTGWSNINKNIHSWGNFWITLSMKHCLAKVDSRKFNTSIFCSLSKPCNNFCKQFFRRVIYCTTVL